MNKRHPDAEALAQLATDATETDKPWERWMYRLKGSNYRWSDCTELPTFGRTLEYSRKPKHLMLNGGELRVGDRLYHHQISLFGTLQEIEEHYIKLILDNNRGEVSHPIYNDLTGLSHVIDINGYEVPEPLRTKPNVGETYFTPTFNLEIKAVEHTWYDDAFDNAMFDSGVCHSNKHPAELHTKALLSFTANATNLE